MTYFCTLASGSEGNCYVYVSGRQRILVDAGKNTRYINQRLGELALSVGDLTHILITHSHSDHILGTPWVIRAVATAMAEEGYTGTFTVAGCRQTLQDVRAICHMILGGKLTKYFDSQILFREVADGELTGYVKEEYKR